MGAVIAITMGSSMVGGGGVGGGRLGVAIVFGDVGTWRWIRARGADKE